MKIKNIVLAAISIIGVVGCSSPTAPSSSEHIHDWSASRGECNECGVDCTHDNWDKLSDGKYDHQCTTCKMKTNHNFVDYSCKYCKETTTLEHTVLPEKYYTKDNEQKGTIQEIYYDTYAYAIASYANVEPELIPVQKHAYIYLPYNYDENKPYNIVYLSHGSGDSEGYWFAAGDDYAVTDKTKTQPMLNNAIASGEIEPTIIVTPCFYTYAPEDSEYTSYNDTIDTEFENENCMWSKYFGYELKDLVRVVESQYLTYANKDISDEGLIASRKHRAFCGLSRGSMISFESVVRYSLDYIGYVGSYSACFSSKETVYQDLVRTHEQYPLYFWYNSCGTKDSLYENHWNVIDYVINQGTKDGIISAGEDPSVNNIYFNRKYNLGHSYESWVSDLLNSLRLFFKN